MTFEDWMRLHNLSESSVKKYGSAINGVMSDWAIESGILDGPLTSVLSHSRFMIVTQKLKELPIYLERNTRGNSMYGSALN